MQWDHLRTFDAVARLGTLSAAALSLGVSQSTVSRHLARLEDDAGSPLLIRSSPITLTQRGASLLHAIQPMVDAALVARSTLDASPELRGDVTLTTVGELVRWLLIKHLPTFYDTYPHLRLHIRVDNQRNSLAAGEADLALRAARPARGDLVAKRLFSTSFAYFASPALALGPDVPWLGLTGSLSNIPEQRHAERVFIGRQPRLLVEDVESLGLAVQAKLGVALLAHGLASRLGGLIEVRPEDIGVRDATPIPARDFWVVVHRTQQHVPKVRAVMQWLDGCRL